MQNKSDELFRLQEQKNQQKKIYTRLYEIGKSLNETISIGQIYDIAVDFATNELNFEKCLIFEHDDKNGWFKVVKSAGYDKPHELQILKIINLLLSGEIIEHLRVKAVPLIHTKEHPQERVSKLVKSLFLQEAYLELFGGDVEIPHGVIVVGNGVDSQQKFTSLAEDEMVMLALGNFTTRLSSAVSNRLFYKAWEKERENLQASVLYQMQLNERLDKEQKFVSALLNNTAAIIATIDMHGVMNRINTYGEEFSGYTQEEIASEPFFWSRFLPQDVRGSVEDIIYKAKEGELVSRHQNVWIGRGAKERVFDWANALIRNSKGEVEYIVTVGMDITDAIEQQQKLEKALDVAENAARIKGEFLANMSHEIRTPMNGILGFIQLFEHTNLDEIQKKYLGIMSTSAKTLLGIINDILDVSKFESGKFHLDPTQIDAHDAFMQMGLALSVKTQEKDIRFVSDVDDALAKCLVFDLLRMQQVIANLLSNAIKFTPEQGEITFSVKLLEQSAIYQKVRISVKDNGIGIAPEHLEKIFEAFSQAAVSTTRKFGGTGLGLTICTRLVTLMGGKLQVKSKEGEGSEFYFELELPLCSE